MRINNENDLASMIHEQRTQRSQSQKEIADLVGLRQATISAFESDPSGSRITTLFKLLSALDLEMELKPKHKMTTQTLTEW